MVTTYPDISAKPHHAEELKQLYTTDTVTSGDNTADKATAIASINTRIDTIIAGGSEIPGQYYYDALLALKTHQASDIDTAIPDTPSGTPTYQDVLQQVADDASAIIQTDTDPEQTRTYACPQCLTLGVVTLNDVLQTCPTCEGYGYTAVEYQINQDSVTYETVIP